MTTYDITHKQLHLAGLILENFKSFGERTVVPMAPITLLFGENSAGKSSILQSLLLLKQTAAVSEPGRPLLRARGDLVDLGSIREMLFAHDPKRVAEISLLFSGGDSLGRSENFWPSPNNAPGTGVRFGCRADSLLNDLVIHELPVYWGDTDRPITRLGEITEAGLKRWKAKCDSIAFPGQRHFRQGQFIDQSEERAYTAECVDADHPAMRDLYDTFTECWEDLAKVLRAWPSTDLMKGWECFQEESAAQSADAESLKYSAQGYLGAVISRFDKQGRDLVAELLERFDNYTYEQYVSDAATRGSTLCRVRGFQLMLPGAAGGRISTWRTCNEEEEPTPEPLRLPSLEGVVGALFRLTYEIDAFEEAYAYTDGVGTVAIDVPHALLPSPSKMTEEAQMFLDGQLTRIAYVGPLRERPARHYMYSGLSWPSVDKTGANLPEMLLADEQVLADLNEALRTMEAGYEMEAVRAEGPGAEGLFWLRLRDARTGIAVSLQTLVSE